MSKIKTATRVYTKLQFSKQEDELLISRVEAYPILYKIKYRCKRSKVKDDAWENISAFVGRSVVDCKRRWKSLRDHKRRKSRDYQNVRSKLLDKLSFIETDFDPIVISSDDSDVEIIEDNEEKHDIQLASISEETTDKKVVPENNSGEESEANSIDIVSKFLICDYDQYNNDSDDLHCMEKQTEVDEFDIFCSDLNDPVATTSNMIDKFNNVPISNFFDAIRSKTKKFPSDVQNSVRNEINIVVNNYAILNAVNNFAQKSFSMDYITPDVGSSVGYNCSNYRNLTNETVIRSDFEILNSSPQNTLSSNSSNTEFNEQLCFENIIQNDVFLSCC